VIIVLDTNIVAKMFIECAVEAQADYLVTGDIAHLLALKQAAGIPIVAVSDFLRLIGVRENPTWEVHRWQMPVRQNPAEAFPASTLPQFAQTVTTLW
jgi:hypothetical protein